MAKYGQYCPIAQALEMVGDRWTLLIIRDMLTGTTQFNDLARGLPGLSTALLAKRLRQLQDAGIIEKQALESGRQSTSYHLTPAGEALKAVIQALLIWGADWAFGDPSPEQLDPLLLMWWIHQRVNLDRIETERVVIQFDFLGEEKWTYWLMLTADEAALCLTDPGFDIDVLVTAELATFFKLWLGRIDYEEAVHQYGVRVEGHPRLVRAFPGWFAWSVAASTVRAARQSRPLPA